VSKASRETENLVSAAASFRAAAAPRSIPSRPFSKLAVVMPARSGWISRSSTPSSSICSAVLRYISTVRVWPPMLKADFTPALSAGLVPMSTAMMTSAPRSRATSTGRFFETPPSTSRRSSSWTGEKMPGIAMLARSARARLPSARITASPVFASVATARNGIASSSKSRTVAAGSVSSPRMFVTFWPSIRPLGSAMRQSLM
jgi:hypothetical protein